MSSKLFFLQLEASPTAIQLETDDSNFFSLQATAVNVCVRCHAVNVQVSAKFFSSKKKANTYNVFMYTY